MKRTIRAWALVCGVGVGLANQVGLRGAEPAVEADQASEAKQAAAQVHEYLVSALQAEAEGDFLARQRLLQSAALCGLESPELKWQQGYVGIGERWVTLDDCVEQVSGDSRLADYEARRDKLLDTWQNHLALAQWCAAQKLLPQARAHFERVLQFNSDEVTARVALGYRLIAGEWISPEQMAAWADTAAAAEQSLLTYGERLRKIARDLESGLPRKEAEARKILLGLDAAEAIPAVQAVFGQANEEVALLVIDWLAQLNSVAGSKALLQYACVHSQPSVRAAATQQLKQRPLHDFVPELLSMLSSPVFSTTVPYFNRDGSLAGYRQAFAKEEHERTQVYTLDMQYITTRLQEQRRMEGRTRLNRLELANVINNAIEVDLRRQVELESRTRAVLAQRGNQGIVQKNLYVLELLSEIADREFSSDPRDAWQWWDTLNETEYQKSKPMRQRGYQDQAEVVRMRPRTHECFVAGTLVMTTRGPRSIDSIVAGDTLFARDVESGALVIKPVLQATQRPAAPTVVVSVDGESLQCTSGHLFWVSGQGWKKASELVPGDVLHAAGEPTLVTSVKPADSQVTYNLLVADCNTYFVGKSRVLSHDVTPREATDQIVPGLAKFASKN